MIEDNILFFRYLLFPVVLIFFLFFLTTYALADDAANEKHKWFLTIFAGPSAQPDLENVLLFNMRFEDETYIAVAALAMISVLKTFVWKAKIGELVTTERAVELCVYYGLNHLAGRIEENPVY